MRFVFMQEQSAGNESVGSEWIETKTFDETTTLAQVWKWATKYEDSPNKQGKLMMQLDEDSIEVEVF